MKLGIVSDLHDDIWVRRGSAFRDETPCDVLIAAGDLEEGPGGPAFLRRAFPNADRVVYVPGNHEHYRHGLEKNTADIEANAALHDVVHLQRGKVLEYQGIVFLGATLWTDFELFGREHRQLSMMDAVKGMNDFRLIRKGTPSDKAWPRFTPVDAAAIHRVDRRWIEEAVLSEKKDRPDGKIVVVTHHAPSAMSLSDNFHERDPLNPSFASSVLPDFLLHNSVDLWVHGHVHQDKDYVIGKTRVIVHPKGYPSENYKNSNDYQMKVVEI